MSKAKTECIASGCHNKGHSRGLCQGCLAEARGMMQRGERTEIELISAGLMLPRQKRGPKSEGKFAKAVRSKLAKRASK